MTESAKPTTIATPWGKGRLVEEISIEQAAGERRFGALVQLVETADGDRLVRLAYSTGGTARRGPVTLRLSDLARLRAAIAEQPGLVAALHAVEGSDV